MREVRGGCDRWRREVHLYFASASDSSFLTAVFSGSNVSTYQSKEHTKIVTKALSSKQNRKHVMRHAGGGEGRGR